MKAGKHFTGFVAHKLWISRDCHSCSAIAIAELSLFMVEKNSTDADTVLAVAGECLFCSGTMKSSLDTCHRHSRAGLA